MEAYIKDFFKKFIASLYLSGVEFIPFSGDEFQKGVVSMQGELKDILPERCMRSCQMYL